MSLTDTTVKSSETALAVLTFLSAAESEQGLEVPVHDPIGPRLIRWSDGKYRIGKVRRLDPFFRWISERSDPGAYGFMIARLLHMDAVVRQMAAEGIDQLVVLGAGYDTRAYRMREELSAVRVFEVDLPATSRDKRARLKKVLGSVPSHVTYVEVDFNRESPFDRLRESGYDASARTLFVFSGVSMYLPMSAVLNVFSQVSENSSAGSSLLFDYFFDDLMTSPERYYGGSQWITRVTDMGEEPLCGIAMGEIDELLAGRGLRLMSQYDMPELAVRYLRRRDGTSVARPLDFAAVAHAAVAE